MYCRRDRRPRKWDKVTYLVLRVSYSVGVLGLALQQQWHLDVWVLRKKERRDLGQGSNVCVSVVMAVSKLPTEGSEEVKGRQLSSCCSGDLIIWIQRSFTFTGRGGRRGGEAGRPISLHSGRREKKKLYRTRCHTVIKNTCFHSVSF